ncbi:MAG: hypothetical protein QOE13_3282 [Gaiellaceae bacterium]|nr:hypothetical protein [Gaiellaceae bacterium]
MSPTRSWPRSATAPTGTATSPAAPRHWDGCRHRSCTRPSTAVLAFLFLTGQWDGYNAADPDGALLRQRAAVRVRTGAVPGGRRAGWPAVALRPPTAAAATPEVPAGRYRGRRHRRLLRLLLLTGCRRGRMQGVFDSAAAWAATLSQPGGGFAVPGRPVTFEPFQLVHRGPLVQVGLLACMREAPGRRGDCLDQLSAGAASPRPPMAYWWTWPTPAPPSSSSGPRVRGPASAASPPCARPTSGRPILSRCEPPRWVSTSRC